MDKLDSIIHQPVRLQIMAVLCKMTPEEEADFTYLKKLLQLTDGNLGAHLLKLEEADYTVVNKIFVKRKPKTYIKATGKGRDAFKAHVEALRRIVDTDSL